MSVEEAREEVCYYDRNSPELERLVDRLILAVKAEMPCYMTHGEPSPLCGRKPADWDNDPRREAWPDDELRFCPSCQARAELAASITPA